MSDSWKQHPNVAQYADADWSGHIQTINNTTADAAKKVADENDEITFFFFARQPMVLNTKSGKQMTFSPGDAVFFKGEYWFGSAPQCDAYVKTWVKHPNVAQFADAEWDTNKFTIVHNTTVEAAKTTADADPEILFFFFCRQGMVLNSAINGNKTFSPGDAVFFKNTPWFGSAPQCDAYVKGGNIDWTPTANVAQYAEADWGGHVTTTHNTTVEEAKAYAAKQNQITFFFFAREYMILESEKNGQMIFNPGDAVFFSRAFWGGSAPQCDVYTKTIKG